MGALIVLRTTSTPTSQPITGQQPARVAKPTYNVELVGQIGGVTYPLAVRGSYAYIGVGPRLTIVNISDPAHPTVAGQTPPLPGIIRSVVVEDSYAYVAVASPRGKGSLRVIDVSDSTAPTEIGAYDTIDPANDVQVAGGYAYVTAEDAGLRVIDVSNPATPVEMGAYITSGDAWRVHVAGEYAYVAVDNTGLLVIDVSNPAAPRPIGRYPSLHTRDVEDVYIAEGYVYMAERSNLRVLDISHPESPEVVGTYDTSGFASSVFVAGDYAYVTVYTAVESGLRVIDVSNPAAPVGVGAYVASAHARGTFVTGNYAYLAVESGLRVIDVSNPAAPAEVGAYVTSGAVNDVYVADSYAFVACGRWRYGGLQVVDVSDPAAPAEVGHNEIPRVAGHHYAGLDVHVAGNYAYLAAGDAGLRLIDVSDPATPVAVGAYDRPDDHKDYAYDVHVANKHAYVTYQDDLGIIDVSDPAAPAESVFYDTPGSAWGVYVAEDYAYVADGWFIGLQILDVSDPATPVAVGAYNPPGFADSVYVAGDYAYLATWTNGAFPGGLRVIDVSNPAAPVGTATYETLSWSTHDVHVAGSYAYVVGTDTMGDGGASGLWVFDVSNPAAPTEVGAYITPGSARSVFVTDNYVYVAAWEGGLFILRFPPTESVSIPIAGGRLASTFDQTTYTFAAGTFTDTVTITHTPRLSDSVPSTGSLIGTDHFFDVRVVFSDTGQPAQPTRPYTVTVQYADTEKGPAIEDTLALYAWDGSQWTRESTSTVDTEANTVTAAPDHFGLWAVLGETWRMYLPVVLRND